MAAARRTKVAVAAVVAAVMAVGVIGMGTGGNYEVQLVMPSAARLTTGTPVWIDGHEAGNVRGLEARDSKAVVTLTLDGDSEPLREGTTSRVEWNSALGERLLTLVPGPATNAVIPDGGMIEGESRQIEVDQVLAALDEPTRVHLSSLVSRLDTTAAGSEDDLRRTLESAGPAVSALGEVLRAVGSDGPAIKQLVTQLNEMSGVAAERQDKVRGVVENLSAMTSETATHQEQLADALGELPSTLDAAEGTLNRVPAAADATVPLLNDLEEPSARLLPVARNLSPLLTDLRPAVARLRPTLDAANHLLERTPELIDTAHGVLPPLRDTLLGYQPAVAFLRPYSPELAGWLSNWSQAFAHYDGQGHVWTGLLAPGPNAVNESPVQPPGSVNLTEPAPGQLVGQPWTDANGDGIR